MEASVVKAPTVGKLCGENSTYRSGEMVIQVPDHDFDVIFKLPNGQTLQAQFRPQGACLDICLPHHAAANCWKDDNQDPAEPLTDTPHVLYVKQVAFCLDPVAFVEK